MNMKNDLMLKELIQKHNFESVWVKISEKYPDSHKESYEYTWNQLQKLEVIPTNGVIIINHIKDNLIPEEPEEYESVSGNFYDEPDTTYSLMFTSWQEWLGMKVDNSSLENYGEEEFIAHCLWEMTFVGFDPCEIDMEREKMEIMEQDLLDPEKRAKMNFLPLDFLFEDSEEEKTE